MEDLTPDLSGLGETIGDAAESAQESVESAIEGAGEIVEDLTPTLTENTDSEFGATVDLASDENFDDDLILPPSEIDAIDQSDQSLSDSSMSMLPDDEEIDTHTGDGAELTVDPDDPIYDPSTIQDTSTEENIDNDDDVETIQIDRNLEDFEDATDRTDESVIGEKQRKKKTSSSSGEIRVGPSKKRRQPSILKLAAQWGGGGVVGVGGALGILWALGKPPFDSGGSTVASNSTPSVSSTPPTNPDPTPKIQTPNETDTPTEPPPLEPDLPPESTDTATTPPPAELEPSPAAPLDSTEIDPAQPQEPEVTITPPDPAEPPVPLSPAAIPTIDPSELAEKLQAANEALDVVQGMTSDNPEYNRSIGRFYMKLSSVGNTASKGELRPSQREEISNLLSKLATGPSVLKSIINIDIAPKWVGLPKRQHNGVFVVAKISGPIEPQGRVGYSSAVVRWQKDPSPMTIFGPTEDLKQHAGKQILVIGSIEVDPDGIQGEGPLVHIGMVQAL